MMSLGSLYEGLDIETKNIRQLGANNNIDVSNSGWFHDEVSRMKFMASQLQRTRLLKDQLQQSQLQAAAVEEEIRLNEKQEPIGVLLPAEDMFNDNDIGLQESLPLSKDGQDTFAILEPEIITNLSPMDVDFPAVEDEYNPLKPNNYDSFARERSFKREIERLERIMRAADERKRKKEQSRKHSHKQRHKHRSSSSESDDDSHRKSRNSSKSERAAIPPPASLADSNASISSEDTFQAPGKVQKGLSVAANIMSKYGWKEGMGLGKASQGISTALSVEKTSKRGGKIINSTAAESLKQLTSSEKSAHLMEMLKQPTRIILLLNMVGRGEVDPDLNEEVSEECRRYGSVVKTAIYEIPDEAPDEEAVRIFIEFQRTECAIKAIVDLHGRFFAGRIVTASFYDEEKFTNMQLYPSTPPALD